MATAKFDDNNPLRKLLAAEKEAAEIIAREERFRSKRLQEAEQAAQEIYESRRAEEEAKFQAEAKATEGEGDEKMKQLLAKTEADKQAQIEGYNKAKETVVELLLHHTTTCGVTLTESEKQAFLAIARKKSGNNATPEDE